jgi:NAD dependent epimerase/dehydratase family enzyme
MAVLVTEGVRAVPRRLEELGYRFARPDLEGALRAATGR